MQPSVRVIKANPFVNRTSGLASTSKRLNVAAYARVSTNFEEQEDSFERQVEYYSNYIANNPSWHFVKVYSDPGISGTRAEKRPGFQQMIKDCKEGKIDKIMVKSIARFARNTVDALKYIRELKEMGIGIFFESQNIDTSTPGGDILITILAATAEEESRTISKNVKWSYQKKFEKGDFHFNVTNFLGYRRDENKKVVIVEEEAQIVRRIYREFLNGKSYSSIAKGLSEDGVLTPSKKGTKWQGANIYRILTNEKYYGCAWMGKTFKPDVLSKKRYRNEGQVESYILENAFEGIIDKPMFEMVQAEIQSREGQVKRECSSKKLSSKYIYSRALVCGCCGGFYTRCNNMRKDGKKIASWWCVNQRRGTKTCHQGGISEASIQGAFVKVVNDLVSNIDDIKVVLKASISSVLLNDPKDKVAKIDERIEELQLKMLEAHKRKTNGTLSFDEYQRQGGKISLAIEDAKKEKNALVETYNNAISSSKRIQDILNVLDKLKPTEEYNEDLFRRLVDSVVITNRTHLKFKFKVGLEREIDVEVK